MGESYYSVEGLKEFALSYFYKFSCKELTEIADMLDDQVMLEDWENKAYNSAEVIGVFQKIFDSVDNISVTPMRLMGDGETIIAQLMITINGQERIYVVDVITFNPVTGKIKGIQAYKG
jgi:hypothetical protein